jgi:hypothetical protein
MVQPFAVTTTFTLESLTICEYKRIVTGIVVRSPTLVQPCPTAGCQRDRRYPLRRLVGPGRQRRSHRGAGLRHPVVVERLEEKGQGFRS